MSGATTMKLAPVEATGTTLAGESVSVIVLVSERPEGLRELYHEYAIPLRTLGCPFEFIFIVDAQWHTLSGSLTELAQAGEAVRVFQLAHTVGETALLRQARAQAKGSILLTLPPYPRVMPDVLPTLVTRVAQGADLVLARRWPRRDSLINRAQNRVLHALMRPLLGRGIHDVACGVRAMRPHVVEESMMHGDFLRFLPFMAMRQGMDVVELNAEQHPGDVRTRVYSPRTYLSRLLDVLALYVLLRFSEKPLRFFGTIGVLSSLVGSVLLLMIFSDKLGGQSIANRPLLLLAGLLIVAGIEAIALGLIGEIIVYLYTRHVGRQPVYRVREEPGER